MNLNVKKHSKYMESRKVEFFIMLILMLFSVSVELSPKDKDQQKANHTVLNLVS